MTALAQTLVWVTMIAFLYIVWSNQQRTSPLRIFPQSRHLRYVLNSLQTLWVVIGLSAVVSLGLLSLPSLVQAASAAMPSCVDSNSSQAPATAYGYRRPSAGICGTGKSNPSDTYPAKQDDVKQRSQNMNSRHDPILTLQPVKDADSFHTVQSIGPRNFFSHRLLRRRVQLQPTQNIALAQHSYQMAILHDRHLMSIGAG